MLIDENKCNVLIPKRYNEKIPYEYIIYFNQKKNLIMKYLGGKYNEVSFTTV